MKINFNKKKKKDRMPLFYICDQNISNLGKKVIWMSIIVGSLSSHDTISRYRHITSQHVYINLRNIDSVLNKTFSNG